MMNNTKIEWCNATVNPVVGCTFKCPYCYARRMSQRFGFVDDFEKPQFFEYRLKALDCKQGKIIFMDSMSDVADWEDMWFIKTLHAIRQNPQHRYLFLSKRPEILREKNRYTREKNIWFGVSVTRPCDLERIKELPQTDEHNMFVSIEPLQDNLLLSEMDTEAKLALGDRIGWIIIGAETGNRKEKIKPNKAWIDDVLQFAHKYAEKTSRDIPIFMKDSLVPIVGEENMIRHFPDALCDFTL